MTKPNPAKRPARTNDEYRWTRPKLVAFLRSLGTTGSVTLAARAVGMSRQSAYRLRARSGPGLARVWDEGLALARTMRAAQGDTPR